MSHLWTRTTISSSKKLFALRKTKSWIAIKGNIGGRKNYFLFVVDSCSGCLATVATATALPVPPAILIISYCSIALNFGNDFVLLPSRVYPPQLLLNQNCLPLFHLQIFMCSTLRFKKPFLNSSAKTFCRKPSRVDKRKSKFFSPSF